jgi:hypothetical protein
VLDVARRLFTIEGMSAGPREVRAFAIDGRKVLVVDSLLRKAEIKSFDATCQDLTFRKKYFSSREHKAHRLWGSQLDLDSLSSTILYEEATRLAGKHFECDRIVTDWASVNMLSAGDVTFPHRDVNRKSETPGKAFLTFIYFVNAAWDADWGADFIFYDSKREPVACVGAKPGRLLVFEGQLFHKANPPSNHVTHPRLTLVFKSEARTR